MVEHIINAAFGDMKFIIKFTLRTGLTAMDNYFAFKKKAWPIYILR
jgi:hypothetical protein